MRQLLPEYIAEVDPVVLYAADVRTRINDRPWVVVNMITSIDGATAVDGRSGALGGPADKAVFRALREVPDVILVGAATVRTEGYGPVQLGAEARERRRNFGRSEVPRLAIVSGSLELDPDSPMFAEAERPPLVLTSAQADPARRVRLESVAEVHTVGEARVSMTEALSLLGHLGVTCVLCEGGPTLNAQLLAQDLVDEWCQTTSPMLVGGESSRAAVGPEARVNSDPQGSRLPHLHLDRLLEADGMLLARYLRQR